MKQLDIHFLFDEDTYIDEELFGKHKLKKKDEGGFKKNRKFYKTGFTKVSEFFAFKLMPNLKVRIDRVLD